MSASPSKPLRFAHEAMDATFVLYVDPEDRTAAAGVSATLWQRVDEIESRVSSWLDSSDLGQLHHAPVGQSVVMSLDNFYCLTLAKALYQRTAGAFDISMGPVIKQWKAAAPKPPDPSALQKARSRVGLDHLLLDPQKITATLTHPDMRLDLGGLAKGYALDCLKPLLRDYGLQRWLLSAGGSTLLAGAPPRATPEGWAVGLGKALPAGHLRHRALSASGTLFRSGHIIDPRTGHPAESPALRAWSVAPTAALSDGMSTAALLLDEAALTRACHQKPRCGARWLKPDEERQDFGDWTLAGKV